MDPSTTPVWRSPARGTLLESPVWCEQSNRPDLADTPIRGDAIGAGDLDVASGNLTPLSWEGPHLEEDRFNDGVTDRLVSA